MPNVRKVPFYPPMKIRFLSLVALAGWLALQITARADSPLAVTAFSRTGTNTSMRFDPLPGIDAYTIFSSSNLSSAFTPNTNFSWVPTGQPEYVVDNPAAAVSGTWTTSSSASDRYGTDYRYKTVVVGGTNYLKFTPNLAQAGTYQVYTWHSQGTNRTAGAPHIITHSGGTNTVFVNQKNNGGTWNLLGQFNFAAGTSGNVKITDGAT
ncbi:MAG: D-alanyl-D-alanine carboxypeptidase precursor, partial [Verrucomicrobiales bacterium]|nr:D-alanyl-D-alanine carboxypeptidase precursor [Verrucomicrobiales bacterium]